MYHTEQADLFDVPAKAARRSVDSMRDEGFAFAIESFLIYRALPIHPLKHRPFKQLLIEMKAVGERDWTDPFLVHLSGSFDPGRKSLPLACPWPLGCFFIVVGIYISPLVHRSGRAGSHIQKGREKASFAR